MNIMFWLSRRVFLKRRAQVYDQIAFALEHNAPPAVEIRHMFQNALKRGSPLAPVFKHWLSELQGSAAGRFAMAMRDTLPNSEFALLASADETQKLPQGLRFLATAVKQIEEMRRAIVGAFKSVWLPTAMLIGLFFGVDAFFFPMIEESIDRKSWPALTKIVAGIAHEMSAIVGVSLIVVPLLIALWLYLLPYWTGPMRKKVWEKTILFNKYRDYQCALFLVNLAFLMEAGHAVREALQRIGIHSNAYIKNHIAGILTRLDKDASNAGEALVSTGLFSEELGDLLTNYARWSNWHTQIRQISNTALDIVTEDVKGLGPAIEKGLQLALGLTVMIVFASGALAAIEILSSTSQYQ